MRIVPWLVVAALVIALVVVAGQEKPEPRVVPGPTPTATPEKAEEAAAPAGDLEAPPVDPGERVTQPPSQSELRDETPADVPNEQLDKGFDKTKDLAEPLPDSPQPVGGAQIECRQDFSGQVYSDRVSGAQPTEFVLHYTVSGNVVGDGDVRAIQAFFKRTRAASATYIVDFEGHCLQMVPESKKAWTQGAANSWAISVEIIATGSETREQWLNSPLFRQGLLASLVRDSMKRWGLPLKRVDPAGCVFPPGWTDHNALECGNNHTDVTPAFPYDVFQKQLTDTPKVPITARHRSTCKKVHSYRAGERTDKNRQAQRVAFIEHAGLKCVNGKPQRRAS